MSQSDNGEKMIISIFFDRSVESLTGNAFIKNFFDAYDDRYTDA